jgi:hypothetical protein
VQTFLNVISQQRTTFSIFTLSLKSTHYAVAHLHRKMHRKESNAVKLSFAFQVQPINELRSVSVFLLNPNKPSKDYLGYLFHLHVAIRNFIRLECNTSLQFPRSGGSFKVDWQLQFKFQNVCMDAKLYEIIHLWPSIFFLCVSSARSQRSSAHSRSFHFRLG